MLHRKGGGGVCINHPRISPDSNRIKERANGLSNRNLQRLQGLSTAIKSINKSEIIYPMLDLHLKIHQDCINSKWHTIIEALNKKSHHPHAKNNRDDIASASYRCLIRCNVIIVYTHYTTSKTCASI